MKLTTRCTEHDLRVPLIMGILNLDPGSFSGDGVLPTTREHGTHALIRAENMLEDGAKIIDIGAVSTRPGAPTVTEAAERDRLQTVFKAIRPATDALISIDTFNPNVAGQMAGWGADIINDVGTDEGSPISDVRMAQIAAQYRTGLVIMHGRQQRELHHGDIVDEIIAFWQGRIDLALHWGVDYTQLILDPGLGFGKTFMENIELLDRLSELCQAFNRPVLVGASRKGFIGRMTGIEIPTERDEATAAITAQAVEAGAKIIRVHNVPENVAALSP